MHKHTPTLFFAATLLSFSTMVQGQQQEIRFQESPTLDPPGYVCYQTPATITIDGIISPEEWDAAEPITRFFDIEGEKGPAPHLKTIVRMLHDNEGLYIAAQLEEPHVWATITRHDGIIFQDNAFEIFFNPTNDTHHYLEYEVNALGTVWDLYLSRPYRDNPVTFSSWEFVGMKTEVSIDGTLNDPSDIDRGWNVEIFIPWRSLYEVVGNRRRPAEGEQIRMNFMRVHWPLEVVNGEYVKKTPEAGQYSNESFWLWSPIGVRSAHIPEQWGYVQFTEQRAGETVVSIKQQPEEQIKWLLRKLYYRQNEYLRAVGRYADTLQQLQADTLCNAEELQRLTLHTTPSLYEIIYTTENGDLWHIRQDGWVWETATKASVHFYQTK